MDDIVRFARHKYDRELLIDCGKMSENTAFRINHNPFVVAFHELFFITEGRGIFALNEERIAFEPGTVLLLPPYKCRQWLRIDEAIDGYVLLFEEAFISTYFNDAFFLYRFHYFYNQNSPSSVQIPDDEFPSYLLRLEEINQELNHLQADSDHFLRAALYHMLIRINRQYQAETAITGDFFTDQLTLRFRKMLEENIRRHHQVADYTDNLQVSRSHLNKTLKKFFGKSASQLIRERLLAECMRELLYHEASVAEISHRLHFSEPSNFNRFFREMTGKTPHQFRRQQLP